MNPVLESLRIRAEKRLERAAMETYRGRWLGLWSPNDEAINGLRATLDLSLSFVGQIAPRERILFSDHLALLSRPYYWILAPVFNALLRPQLDRLVRSSVIKTAQGNNRPAAEVIAVSPFPVGEMASDAHPALPSERNRCLVERANQHARDIAPKLRELLALHIAWARPDAASIREAARIDESLWNWFCQFKSSVRETSKLDSTLHLLPPRPLVRPRRRARLRKETGSVSG